MQARELVWLAVLSLSMPAAAFAQGTDREREACTPDVFRLCGQYVPDADRITSCLRNNGPQLSRACYDVFFPPDAQSPDRRPERGARPDFGDDDDR
jgi:hypothetical protein